MYLRKSVFIVFLVVALILGGVGVLFAQKLGISNSSLLTNDEYEEYQYLVKTYGKLEDIKNFVDDYYYVDVDADDLVEGAYYGLVDALNDPYSEYVSAEEYEDYIGSMLGEYSGVGMSFYGNEDDVLEVVQVYRNSPAKEAGMQPGDIILKVDGVAYSGSQSSEAASNIRGKEGTSVEITYRRDGVENTVTMVRASIQVETIAYEMLDDKIGYIQIDSFESATANDFKAALDDLTAQGAKGLVIDLRNNGGGLVDVSVKIADMLMDQGTVVYTEDQYKKKDYYTTKAGRTELPYVVLVNEYTASASEILSAGIQDNNEGVIVGTKTYGKGIIQSLYPSSMIQDRYSWDDGSAVKITIMQYFSPSGKTIHKVGITPDYIVELVEGDETDYQLEKAIEVLKSEVK
ncbi:MAG: S41 family peptidase [Firmicutes bacterium]|jgi:carboxyl-terminal processing protease|nr:S41 family peptidase [Bacillota bacterium]